MIKGGIRVLIIICAVLLGTLAFSLFIQNSALSPLGAGKVTAFSVPSDSGTDEGSGSGENTPSTEELSEQSARDIPSAPSTSGVPAAFDDEESFVDSFVEIAKTTIATDYGLKSVEVREIVRNNNQEVSEVIVEGTHEGYFMGLIPVRIPTLLVVSHIDDQAYVRKQSRPWWGWFVRLRSAN